MAQRGWSSCSLGRYLVIVALALSARCPSVRRWYSRVMAHVRIEAAALAAVFAQAQARLSSGDRAEAERLCREILRLQPEDFPALYLLGVISASERRHEEAAAFLVQAAALRPNEPSTHNNLGNVLLALDRAAESLERFERALQLNPNYAEAHYNRGNALCEMR